MTPAVASELILCFPVCLLDDHNLRFQGFTSNLAALHMIFWDHGGLWDHGGPSSPRRLVPLLRSYAESDITYKQLVTYSVVQVGFSARDARVLTYLRGDSGGEPRLHARRSLGLGGHVPGDCRILQDLRADARREINEEVELDRRDSELSSLFYPAGLINDDSNEVGRVHLGVVFRLVVQSSEVRGREGCIADIKWMSPGELGERVGEFETWSQILINQMFL